MSDTINLNVRQKSCYIAGGVEDRLETILHDVPRWSCRMDVISCETNQIDKQEHDGKTQIEITLVHEIEAEAE